MKTKKLTAIVLLMGIASATAALAGGTTGACTAPTGSIELQPDQTCNGTKTVALGKEITLKATNLKDKDCYCGRGVQDTINTSTGVRWSVGGGSIGTLAGGTDGTPKTYTAPPTTHTSVAVRLQLDDEATAANTYNDGGFTEIASLNLDIVKPNAGSNAGGGYQSCPSSASPATHTSGRFRLWSITASQSGCTVDFSALKINESGCQYVNNGCNLGAIQAGSNNPAFDQTLNGSNTAPNADITAICHTSNWTPAATCTSTSTCDWSITSDSSTYHDWSRWDYSVTVPNPGGINQLDYSRGWKQAL